MDSYLLLPFVEIEIRLGTLTNKFDTGIDSKYFQQILVNLEAEKWVSVSELETKEYLQSDKRLIVKKNNEVSLIMKENVFKNTIQLKNSPFDIRFSVNQEFSLNSYIQSFDKKDAVIRLKKRKTFTSENFKYDLSEVSETINGITKNKFEIEIELLVTKETLKWDSNYIHDFLVCKIYDLINIVEPMDSKDLKIKLA